jgi:transcription antitermination factor NusG
MSVSTINSSWYALHVRPNYELSVASRLRELGLEEYLPIKRSHSVPRRNRFSEGMPLFPGYIFSFLDLDAGPRLYSVPGMIRILGYGGQPTPVSDEEIKTIRSIVTSQLPVQCVPYFVAGEQIVLTKGPLRGVKGSFIATKKGGQLVVSLPLLNRSLTVTVLSEWVAQQHTPSVTVAGQ